MDMEVILVFKNDESDVIKTWWKKMNSGRGRRLNNARDSVSQQRKEKKCFNLSIAQCFLILKK